MAESEQRMRKQYDNERIMDDSIELELIKQAQNNDSEAAALLLEKYQRLLYKAAQQRHLRAVQDEAYQEACLGFYSAVRRFDASLGVPFAGYAKYRVYASVHTMFRRWLRIWRNETAQITTSCGDDEADLCWIDTVAQQPDISENSVLYMSLQQIIAQLPEKQKNAALMVLFGGMTQTQAAAKMHVSVQAVSKNYNKAMNFIRANWMK